jgi:rfaE bifunctional protein nucleotidyltransferase chain/domain
LIVYGDITEFVIDVRNESGRIIFTNGCFDILHIGHVKTIQFCSTLRRTENDVFIIAVNSDDSIRKLKGESRPIFPLETRMEMLNSLKCVDMIISFDDISVLSTIKKIRPQYLIKGGSTGEIVGEEFVKSYGGQVYRTPLIENASVTQILEKLS